MAVKFVLCFIHEKHNFRIGLKKRLDEVHVQLLASGVAWRCHLDHLGAVRVDLFFQVLGS